MLATKGKPILAIEGINQQNFQEIQLVVGTYPRQAGLQQRIPGKTLQQIRPAPVGGIHVFYMVYGRSYRLLHFGTLQIEEIEIPPITIPGLAPRSNLWFDTFLGYPNGLISRLWGGGVWIGSVGICETIIEGAIDPFLIYATIPPGRIITDVPIADPPPAQDPQIPPVSTTSPRYLNPGSTIDVLLRKVTSIADNSCTGQGGQPLVTNDYINYRQSFGNPVLDAIGATGIAIGAVITWHGINIGREADVDGGYVQGTCTAGLPPQHSPIVYYVYANKEFGVES